MPSSKSSKPKRKKLPKPVKQAEPKVPKSKKDKPYRLHHKKQTYPKLPTQPIDIRFKNKKKKSQNKVQPFVEEYNRIIKKYGKQKAHDFINKQSGKKINKVKPFVEEYKRLVDKYGGEEAVEEIINKEEKEEKIRPLAEEHNQKNWKRKEKPPKDQIMSKEAYAELQYQRIMNTIEQMKELSSRRQYGGWWILKSFIQENYYTYGIKFIDKIQHSPLFDKLVNALDLYDAAKTEEMAQLFIENLGASLGVDLSESNDFFGRLYDEDDEE